MLHTIRQVSYRRYNVGNENNYTVTAFYVTKKKNTIGNIILYY